MIFKEETISSERIYEGAILNLRKDKVTVKDGRTSYREIVEHNGGAALAALTEDRKLVMVRQFRKAIERDILEVPAGKTEKGEDPLETARRELREETGYTAKEIRLIGKIYPSVGYTQEKIFIYLCTGLTPGETDFDENEALDILEYDLDELYRMALAGEIEDAKTLTAILLVKALV
ncbi:MAG: NUDIX hydrolase [Clostridia bacterium]|nr:NUDIX hydrolase [Clostridia bacterium]